MSCHGDQCNSESRPVRIGEPRLGGACAVGVDGCRAGWVAVALDGGRWSVALHRHFAELLDEWRDARRILVDMPIGLPESAPRACDAAARRLLGYPRAASVFPVPARAALETDGYDEACAVNVRLLGRRLSRQSWNLREKIREVDACLRAARTGPPVLEAHPELAFRVFAGGRAAVHAKRTAAGAAERLALLRPYLSAAGEMLERAGAVWPRAWVGADDLLDALALAVAAGGALRQVPEVPPHDGCGLMMAIAFPDSCNG